MTDASPSPIKMAPIKMAPIKMAARDVSVFYGAKQALNQVSIDVDMDNVTAFIGPSGCGKSTFLRTLNRMNDTTPSARVAGTITPDGDRRSVAKGKRGAVRVDYVGHRNDKKKK